MQPFLNKNAHGLHVPSSWPMEPTDGNSVLGSSVAMVGAFVGGGGADTSANPGASSSGGATGGAERRGMENEASGDGTVPVTAEVGSCRNGCRCPGERAWNPEFPWATGPGGTNNACPPPSLCAVCAVESLTKSG
mmetsp:Transcript_52486/g.122465  ORF Transcript_52486/g.122465 Transcript_52486/m.122465 type:complete len:135 (+) Transcript_52486:468-872(+)